jgi:peptidoglycan hydrolase CwlO-like protein
MSRQLKIILFVVMAVAFALIISCTMTYLDLGKQLRNNESLLAESRATWEGIAAEKETLQAELKEKQAELKEAELSLSEATERAEELKADIETLQQDINTLKLSGD